MDNHEVVKNLINKSHSELFYLIGKDIGDNFIVPPSKNDFIELGKEWLKENYKSLKEKLCTNENIISILKDKNIKERKVELIIAIADLISGIAIGVSPFIVSALLFKEGISSLCSEINA